MLVINDPNASPDRRDRMCQAMLRYSPTTKKEEAQHAAEKASGAWDDLLKPGPAPTKPHLAGKKLN